VVISDHEIPTVCITNDAGNGTKDTPVTTIYSDLGVGEFVVGVEHFSSATAAASNYTIVDVFTSHVSENVFDVEIQSNFLDVLYNINNIVIEIIESDSYNNFLELPTELFVQGFLTEDSHSIKTHYRLNLGSVSISNDVIVSLSLASAKYFNYQVDVFCAVSGTLYSIVGDIRQQNGRLHKVLGDVYAAGVSTVCLPTDIYSSNLTTAYIESDIQQASGTCAKIDTDIYNCTVNTKYIGADFKTRSLFVAGFFLDVNNFTTASGTGYIDIVDFIYEIDETTISITKDFTTMSGTVINDIPNGKRIFFNPLDNFYSDGEIVISVYAESIYGEVLSEDFYLLYGYNLELNESGIFWDAATRVYVTATASNLVVCPNTEGVHYYFDTVELPSFNLGVFINAVEYQDLACSIYPQSTTFYYGRTYKVKISGVKDFNGNIMPDFEYEFTIESP